MNRFHRRRCTVLGSGCLGHKVLTGLSGFRFPSSMARGIWALRVCYVGESLYLEKKTYEIDVALL
jgi:hypothetical protein